MNSVKFAMVCNVHFSFSKLHNFIKGIMCVCTEYIFLTGKYGKAIALIFYRH